MAGVVEWFYYPGALTLDDKTLAKLTAFANALKFATVGVRGPSFCRVLCVSVARGIFAELPGTFLICFDPSHLEIKASLSATYAQL
jgi:hypothetical protein